MARERATIDTVREIAPEFSDTDAYPDSFVGIWLEVAGECVGLDSWDTLASQGQALLTAHFLRSVPTSADDAFDDAAGRDIAAKANGPASVSYVSSATASGDGALLQSTTYGRHFWLLWQRVRGKTTMVAGGMSRWL